MHVSATRGFREREAVNEELYGSVLGAGGGMRAGRVHFVLRSDVVGIEASARTFRTFPSTLLEGVVLRVPIRAVRETGAGEITGAINPSVELFIRILGVECDKYKAYCRAL